MSGTPHRHAVIEAKPLLNLHLVVSYDPIYQSWTVQDALAEPVTSDWEWNTEHYPMEQGPWAVPNAIRAHLTMLALANEHRWKEVPF